MAKLGSSSCRPLLQRMMLLAVLLLASIQAGHPVMAPDEVLRPLLHAVEKGPDALAEALENKVVKTALAELRNKPRWKDFIDGLKKGLKFHKYLCKAQRLVDKLNPGGASGTPYFTVEFLGGGLLSTGFPIIFSYSVTSTSVVSCRSATQPQVQAAAGTMMYVWITGIRVGQEDVPVQPPAYLSATQPYTYYDLQSSLDGRLRDAVNRQVKALSRPWANAKPINTADKLCYAAAKSSLPRIAILVATYNGGVMQTMEMSGGATGTFWYQEQESFMSLFCLGIRRTVELLLP